MSDFSKIMLMKFASWSDLFSLGTKNYITH